MSKNRKDLRYCFGFQSINVIDVNICLIPNILHARTMHVSIKYQDRFAVNLYRSFPSDPRVGHTMDVHSPLSSVLCHSDWLFHEESCPRLDVVKMSIQAVRGLPRLRAPGIVPCIISFSRQLPTCKYLSLSPLATVAYVFINSPMDPQRILNMGFMSNGRRWTRVTESYCRQTLTITVIISERRRYCQLGRPTTVQFITLWASRFVERSW